MVRRFLSRNKAPTHTGLYKNNKHQKNKLSYCFTHTKGRLYENIYLTFYR